MQAGEARSEGEAPGGREGRARRAPRQQARDADEGKGQATQQGEDRARRDDQLWHSVVVAGLHHDAHRPEAVFPDEGDDFRGLVIGHQELGSPLAQEFEWPGVVQRVLGVQPPADALAVGGIGRIREHRHPRHARGQRGLQQGHAVPLEEADALGTGSAGSRRSARVFGYQR